MELLDRCSADEVYLSTYNVLRIAAYICAITRHAFELRRSPLQEEAKFAMEPWFKRFGVYASDPEKEGNFLRHGQFDLFAALSFPEADLEHMKTCLAFFYWAFSTDDLSDEGNFQRMPESVRRGHEISKSVLHDLEREAPPFPYAAMLQDLRKRMAVTATPGTCRRFAKAFIDWSDSQVLQSSNRSRDRFPPLAEFITMRRCTIGAALVEAMVEYSLDIDLPDFVFEHPIIRAMSDCTSDIMTWPNDLCSFNKEQSDGDYQNMVCIVMAEDRVDLQIAVDTIASMLQERVAEYLEHKAQLPSFGPAVDVPLHRYLSALEHFVQGTIVWYYLSPRYFRGVNALDRSVEIKLYPPSGEQPLATAKAAQLLRGTGNTFFATVDAILRAYLSTFLSGVSWWKGTIVSLLAGFATLAISTLVQEKSI